MEDQSMRRKSTPLNIKDPEVYDLARKLSRHTGKSLTEVVRLALRERLAREKQQETDDLVMEKLMEISDRCAARPAGDRRSDEEIIGYDDRGIPA
jgi:antitoxin VapB